MKFYGIDCQGYIKVQQTSGDSPPVFSAGNDERRLIYVHDTINTEDRIYVGGDQANAWVRAVLDDGASTYTNLTSQLGSSFHPLNGSATESITVQDVTGVANHVRITDDWIKLSNGTPITTGDSIGVKIEAGAGGNDTDDIQLFYEYDSPNVGSLSTKWQLLGGGYTSYNDGSNTYTGDPIATMKWTNAAITEGLDSYVDLTTADIRYVRYQHLNDGGGGNTTYNEWMELTATSLGATTKTTVTYPAYPDRQIYRIDEAFNGFVRSSNWTKFDGTAAGASTPSYASVTNVADTIVQRDGAGDIFATVGHLEATSAQYADLAEKYTCDENLPIGTVVNVSDDENFEVVSCAFELSPVVVGVVSRNPAHLMNSESAGLPIGLTGKVEVRVLGAINKGDFIVPAGDGCARKGDPSELAFKMGVALKTDLQTEEKLVECIIK